MNVDVDHSSTDSGLSVDSDSETTQNSVENGRHCVVRFRHCDFIFERRVFVEWGKRVSTSPIKSPNPAKKICLQPISSNNFDSPADENNQIDERINGVLNLSSLFRESYVNFPTKDLISLAFTIDVSCSEECTQQIELESRHRLHDKESQWTKLLIGRITGAIFKDVCLSQSKYPSKQLMSRICQHNKSEDPADSWVRKHFIDVRTKYERIMLNRHKNFVYRKCGLILRSEHPQFCVTPGGVVECECCGRGITEFYLPYEMRNEKMIYSLSCLDETDDYEFNLRKDTHFYYKIQLHMYLTDTNYCDFVIWTTCDYLDIRIKRDENFLFVKVNTAKSFFLRKILPEMLSRRISGF